MLGRGIFANPWVFNNSINMDDKTVKERIDLYTHHIELFDKQWSGKKNFALLKKFAKTYISNFPDSSEFRVKLMEAKTIEDLKTTLQTYKI